MNWINALGAYMTFSFIILLFTSITIDAYGYKLFSWKTIFIFQYELYECIKDELNMFGVIILELIVTILTFGTNIMLFIIAVIGWIFTLLWKLFYLIFKKRGK